MTVGGIRLLLEHGANTDARDNDGKTPLQVAVEHGRHKLATFLSKQGATK
jgi:ankyrin repeat protein